MRSEMLVIAKREMGFCQTPQKANALHYGMASTASADTAAEAATLFHVSDTQGCFATNLSYCGACKRSTWCWILNSFFIFMHFLKVRLARSRMQTGITQKNGKFARRLLLTCRKQFVSKD